MFGGNVLYWFTVVGKLAGFGGSFRSILHANGHEVFRPTLTGLGERSHLLTRAVNLVDTRIHGHPKPDQVGKARESRWSDIPTGVWVL